MRSLVLSVLRASALVVLSLSIAPAATIIHFAGQYPAAEGFSGDGGPATNAALHGPAGLAVDRTGNLFISDQGNVRIRRVDAVTGIITTFAGNGTLDTVGGDDGPATNSPLGEIYGIATDFDGHLFLPEFGANIVRKVHPLTGIITRMAGDRNIGNSGNQGPATAASLFWPNSVALDGAGNFYISESGNWDIRKVDTNGIITVFAGTGPANESSGDGGPARDAAFAAPWRVAADEAGNVFVVDRIAGVDMNPDRDRVRRIDAVTGIITRIAGGGNDTNYAGLATDAHLGAINDIAVHNGRLYIAGGRGNPNVPWAPRVWKVNLSTGGIRVLAGVANANAVGNLGDGGPATAATFGDLLTVGVAPNGDVFIGDNTYARVRRVLVNVNIDDDTPQSFLDNLTVVEGCLTMTNTGRDSLILTNLTLVDCDMVLSNNPALTNVNVAIGGGVGGNVSIDGNDSADAINVAIGGGVGGDVSIDGNDSAMTVGVVVGESIGGSATITENDGATAFDLRVGGGISDDITVSDNSSAMRVTVEVGGGISDDITISDNSSATSIQALGFTRVAGSLNIENNTAAGSVVVIGDLTTVDGSVNVSGNTGALVIDIGVLTTVGEDVVVTENTSASTIDIGVLTTVGGGVIISENTVASVIDMGSLTTINGDFTVAGNTSLPDLRLGALREVGGNMGILRNSSLTDIICRPALASAARSPSGTTTLRRRLT